MTDNVNKWIDVSCTIEDGMVHWPGDIEVRVGQSAAIEDDCGGANVSFMHMSVHTGTHVDAPLHFIPGGSDIAQALPETLIGAAKIIHLPGVRSINADMLGRLDIYKGDRLLFKTSNSEQDWTKLPFLEHYVYLEADAAHYLKNKEVLCIGVDYLSVAPKNNSQEVHKILFGAGITIIEGLRLQDVEAGDYEMVCLPLKIKNADGAPARVLLKKRSEGFTNQGH